MPDLRARVISFCQQHHLRLDTDLGQHFLIDETVLDAILDGAQIREEDHIVEIGSGIGILTEKLLERSTNVTAIEIDARLIPLLRDYLSRGVARYAPTIVQKNALQVPFPSTPYKIVANIPYHITSPLLRHAFLEGTRAPTSMTLLIQREVAERIVDTDNASLLTIIVGLFGTPRIITRVPPSSFLPPPKVDSTVLHIDCFAEPRADAATMEKIFLLTKHAFAQKRKMLSNSLGSLPYGDTIMKEAAIDPTRRPQTLMLDEWIILANAMP